MTLTWQQWTILGSVTVFACFVAVLVLDFH
jgi:hypothetical protein